MTKLTFKDISQIFETIQTHQVLLVEGVYKSVLIIGLCKVESR